MMQILLGTTTAPDPLISVMKVSGCQLVVLYHGILGPLLCIAVPQASLQGRSPGNKVGKGD